MREIFSIIKSEGAKTSLKGRFYAIQTFGGAPPA